jgi:hypothetical protein
VYLGVDFWGELRRATFAMIGLRKPRAPSKLVGIASAAKILVQRYSVKQRLLLIEA